MYANKGIAQHLFNVPLWKKYAFKKFIHFLENEQETNTLNPNPLFPFPSKKEKYFCYPRHKKV